MEVVYSIPYCTTVHLQCETEPLGHMKLSGWVIATVRRDALMTQWLKSVWYGVTHTALGEWCHPAGSTGRCPWVNGWSETVYESAALQSCKTDKVVVVLSSAVSSIHDTHTHTHTAPSTRNIIMCVATAHSWVFLTEGSQWGANECAMTPAYITVDMRWM